MNKDVIFSGPDSKKFWKKINKTKPKKLRWLLYEFGCRLQRLETVARTELCKRVW